MTKLGQSLVVSLKLTVFLPLLSQMKCMAHKSSSWVLSPDQHRQDDTVKENCQGKATKFGEFYLPIQFHSQVCSIISCLYILHLKQPSCRDIVIGCPHLVPCTSSVGTHLPPCQPPQAETMSTHTLQMCQLAFVVSELGKQLDKAEYQALAL